MAQTTSSRLGGSFYPRLQLGWKYDTDELPHERTLQKWFKAAGLSRPLERQAKVKISQAKAVHNIWQVDAKERFILAHGGVCCYLTLIDEYSGACIDAHHFPLSPNQSSSSVRNANILD